MEVGRGLEHFTIRWYREAGRPCLGVAEDFECRPRYNQVANLVPERFFRWPTYCISSGTIMQAADVRVCRPRPSGPRDSMLRDRCPEFKVGRSKRPRCDIAIRAFIDIYRQLRRRNWRQNNAVAVSRQPPALLCSLRPSYITLLVVPGTGGPELELLPE